MTFVLDLRDQILLLTRGGGYSHTLPIRVCALVCAAQRGRDFEAPDLERMGRQMYFYYLEWLFLYNQNNVGYLQITTSQFYYF